VFTIPSSGKVNINNSPSLQIKSWANYFHSTKWTSGYYLWFNCTINLHKLSKV